MLTLQGNISFQEAREHTEGRKGVIIHLNRQEIAAVGRAIVVAVVQIAVTHGVMDKSLILAFLSLLLEQLHTLNENSLITSLRLTLAMALQTMT